ncbi:MAG: HD domain-containing phosphohydrolase [Clostridia bacterium]|jgi:diguanylate cyclase (GGDEF)-like protein/PAS domain S-box-containing protein/putative nucleotidyltransferase with HDIG domain
MKNDNKPKIKENEESYRTITENVADMISKHSPDGRYTYVSPACKRILGYGQEELLGTSLYDLVYPEKIEIFKEYYSDLSKTTDVNTWPHRLRRKDGSYAWVETSSRVIRDSDSNEPDEIICVSRDITKKIEEEKLFKKMVVFTEELLKTGSKQVSYQKILNNLLYISKARLGILTLLNEKTDKFTTVAVAGTKGAKNKADEIMGSDLLGKEWIKYSLKKEKLKGNVITRFSSISEIRCENESDITVPQFNTPLDIGEIVVTKVIVNDQIIGDFTLIMSSGKKLENEKFIEIYSRQIDLFMARIKAEGEVLFLINNDQLTGLYNRRYYEQSLKMLDNEKYFPLTLVMIDVNGLKLTNDAFGHRVGDALLVKIANILKRQSFSDDIVARIGGDEFVILLPQTDFKKAEKFIERLNEAISNEKCQNIVLSLSVGFAVKTEVSDDIEEIYKEAEDNMYKHKLSESSAMKSRTIELILNTLYEKNNMEMLHSKRVSKICESIACKMDSGDENINQIKIAGLMHDIGKIAIEENILNKNQTLNKKDWNEIMRHPEIGYRILSSVSEFSELSKFVLEHHEKWDGTGYPRGLKGKGISWQARIIAVADAYDAMTTERPYKKAKTKDEAIDEINKCSGTQFDPDIVRILIKNILSKR